MSPNVILFALFGLGIGFLVWYLSDTLFGSFFKGIVSVGTNLVGGCNKRFPAGTYKCLAGTCTADPAGTAYGAGWQAGIGGNCYLCPANFVHNPLVGPDASNACIATPSYFSVSDNCAALYRKPGYKEYAADKAASVCYACPTGYSRTAWPVKEGWACSKGDNSVLNLFSTDYKPADLQPYVTPAMRAGTLEAQSSVPTWVWALAGGFGLVMLLAIGVMY